MTLFENNQTMPCLGDWTYQYDLVGNLISQSGVSANLQSGDGYYREYDGTGQLMRIRNGSTAASPMLEEYFYDHEGQRIKVKRYDAANTVVYTPFKEMMRVVNSSGSFDYFYVYDGDKLVARVNPDNSTWFFQTDHLGSSSVVTDENGTIIENTSYDPYGLELSGGTSDVRGYTGQQQDVATGQMYYGARYYLPKWGLFMQPDAVISNVYNPQNLNAYAYVLGNPYKYTDPNGKWAYSINLGRSAGGAFATISGSISIAISGSDEHGIQIG